MLAISIIQFCLFIIIYVLGGIVCGNICVELIREKNPRMSDFLWFWAGFFFNVIAVFMTLCVKKSDDGENK